MLIGEEVDPKLGCSDSTFLSKLDVLIKNMLSERLISIEDLKLTLELDKLSTFQIPP